METSPAINSSAIVPLMTYRLLKIPHLFVSATLMLSTLCVVFAFTPATIEFLPTASAQDDDDPFASDDDDPFGASDDDPFGAGDDPGDAGEMAAPAARPGRRRGGSDASPIDDEDPIVITVRESNPQKPDELVRAMVIMVDIGRPEEARTYLDKLVALELDDKTMFDLNMEFKSDTFVRMRRVPELLPTSAAFVRKLLAASDRYVRQPERIEEFVSQLGDRSSDVRVAATTGLITAREDAVEPLIRAMLDDDRREFHPQYLIALARLGPAASQPLLAIASSDDHQSFVKASQAMVAAKDRAVLPVLLQRLVVSQTDSPMHNFLLKMIERLADSRPSRATATEYLRNEFDELQHSVSLAIPDTGSTSVWNWNAADKTLSHTDQPVRRPLLQRSASVAKTLHQVDEASEDARLRYWIALLEAHRFDLQANEPIKPDETINLNEPTSLDEQIRANAGYLETVLAEAMKTGHVEAAIAATELLGEVGSARMLQSDGGLASPVVRACMHDNPRLRFAAMSTIMKWKPQEAFAGSSQFLSTATMIAGVNGDRRILIVEPNVEFAAVLAGTMAGVGFSPDVTSTAREFLNRAVDSSDYEFMIITAAVNRPGPYEVLQRLRRDPRSKSIPVALIGDQDRLGSEDRLREIERLAELDAIALASPWPAGPQAAQLLAEQMQRLRGRDFLTPETRATQAAVALDGLLEIARNRDRYRFYNLLPHEGRIRRALYQPELGDKVAELLGWLATPSAQRELVNLASAEGVPIKQRKSAASAFANAVDRRGILLTKREIVQQYDLYNASETLAAESQQVLAEILDAMETRVDVKQTANAR